MLRGDLDYHDLGTDYFDRKDRTRAERRLVKRLVDLGFSVINQAA